MRFLKTIQYKTPTREKADEMYFESRFKKDCWTVFRRLKSVDDDIELPEKKKADA